MSNLATDFAQFIADRKKLLRWDDMTHNEKLAIEIAYSRGWADGKHGLLSDRLEEIDMRQYANGLLKGSSR